MRVNGKYAFTLSLIESASTIREKIAIHLQTLPEYIKVMSEIDPSNDEGNIEVCILYNKEGEGIISKPGNVNGFQKIYRESKENFPIISLREITSLWLTTFALDRASIEHIPSLIQTVVSEKVDFTVTDLQRDVKYNFEERYQKFISRYKETSEIRETFERLEEYKINDFNQDKYIQKIVYETKDDLYEVLDNMNMTGYVPFASFDNYYKVYKNFKFLDDGWQYTAEDTLFVALLVKKSPSHKPRPVHFTGCYISKPSSDRLVFEIEINTRDKRSNFLSTLESRLFKSIKVDGYRLVERSKAAIGGYMIVPQFNNFNKWIFADLIMNQSILNNIFFIDEHLKMTKTRKAFHFVMETPGEARHLSATIDDIFIDFKEYKRYQPQCKLNDTILKIQITQARSEEEARKFRKIMGKVLTLYNKDLESRVNIYQKYINGFTIDVSRPQLSLENQKLRDLRPDIFTAGYGKLCQPVKPRIINEKVYEAHPEYAPFSEGMNDRGSDDDESDADSIAGFSVVSGGSDSKSREEKIPDVIDDLEDYEYVIKFPKDDRNPDWFACSSRDSTEADRGYVFPGLIENKRTENSEDYSHLPCCYLQDQRDNPKFTSYYSGISRDIRSSTYIKKTNKICRNGEKAYLPQTAINLLSANDIDKNYVFYRHGADRTPSSFLACLIWATTGKPPSKEGVKQARERLASSDELYTCLQSAYDFTIDTLRSYVSSFRNYLDPKIFYKAFENIFKVNIITINLEGQIVPVRHLQNYIRFSRSLNRFDKLVVIIENHGMRGDGLRYPQCELLIWSDKGDLKKIYYSFLVPSRFSSSLFRLEDQVYNSFSFTFPNLPISLLPPPGIKSIGIDSQGKVSLVYFDNLCAFTDPLPIFLNKIDNTVKINDRKEVEAFILGKGGSVRVSDENIIWTYNNINYTFPIRRSDFSYLTIFNNYRRVARYLQEYLYYIYAVELGKRGNIPDINGFIRDVTVIVEDYQYPSVAREFDLKGGYMRDGKLIVQSEEIRLRLGYALYMEIRRRKATLLEYALRPYIRQYYQMVGDFKKASDFVVISGESALREWMTYKTPEYMFSRYPVDTDTPYFIYLHLTEVNTNRVFLVQNCSTYEEAIGLYDAWIRDGYNSMNITPRYQPPADVTLYIMSGKNVYVRGTGVIQILLWKINNVPHFAALFSD